MPRPPASSPAEGDHRRKLWRSLLIYSASTLVLGPISAPLFYGMIRNIRSRDYVLAALYAVALVEVSLLLPVVAVWMVTHIPAR